MPIKNQYTLRFPFRLAPGQKFSNLENPYDFESLGLNLRLWFQSGLYHFSVVGFPAEYAGKYFIPKLWGSLMWTLLQQGLSPIAELSPQKIEFTEDPISSAENFSKSLGIKRKMDRLDCILDSGSPAVYDSDKAIRVLTVHPVTITQGFSPDRTASFINEALSFPYVEAAVTDTKLKVALDLYNAFFREASDNARFLTLNMVLEALAPLESKHQCALELINRWMNETRKFKEAVVTESEEWEAYDSLIREICFRRKKSIRSSIRNLVYSTLRLSEPNAKAISREAVDLYD